MIQEAIEGANGILVTTEYVRDHLVRDLIDLPPDASWCFHAVLISRNSALKRIEEPQITFAGHAKDAINLVGNETFCN